MALHRQQMENSAPADNTRKIRALPHYSMEALTGPRRPTLNIGESTGNKKPNPAQNLIERLVPQAQKMAPIVPIIIAATPTLAVASKGHENKLATKNEKSLLTPSSAQDDGLFSEDQMKQLQTLISSWKKPTPPPPAPVLPVEVLERVIPEMERAADLYNYCIDVANVAAQNLVLMGQAATRQRDSLNNLIKEYKDSNYFEQRVARLAKRISGQSDSLSGGASHYPNPDQPSTSALPNNDTKR